MVDVIESEDGNPPCCITLHPGFAGVCLNPWALNVAYMAYKQQYPRMWCSNKKLYRSECYKQWKSNSISGLKVANLTYISTFKIA